MCDVEEQGRLGSDGLRDAFLALGVPISEDVARQIIAKCGEGPNGTTRYADCVAVFFG